MRAVFLTLLLIGCTEYGFENPNNGSHPIDDSETTGEGDREETGLDETGDPDTDDTEDDGPPETVLDQCTPDVIASWQSGEIYVKSWEQTTASGVLVAPVAGWYAIYDFSVAESGSSQRNETIFYRVTNSSTSEGLPMYANCGGEWLVLDNDNNGAPPAGTRIYLGTFFLDEGDNTLTMYHFCDHLYRQGSCTAFHDASDSSSTCESSSPNSAHYTGEGICLKKKL